MSNDRDTVYAGSHQEFVAQEGPMFTFKGWVPAWVRLQPTTILIFVILEQPKNMVDWTGELRAKKV